MPSISTATVVPGFIVPTPTEVPHRTRSAGSSVMSCELARLVREPFIVREPGSDTRQSMSAALARHEARLNIALEIKSTETIKQAVIAGHGRGLSVGPHVSRELRDGSLSLLDVHGFPLMLHWYLVPRRGKRLPPVAQAFREFLLREGAALIERIVPARVSAARRASKRRQPKARQAM
jgi:LysR family transcriptional regulator, low CO2-responsive transcriptional regulator